MNYPADYECEGQLSIFDYIEKPYKITKPIRLIELFAGIGSQYSALKAIGANVTSWRCVEFDKYAIASYNAIHGTNYPTIDITQVHGSDLGIVDVESFTYLLTYSFPCTDLSNAGRMLGMAEGSGTRSSLLWEVKRLLDECENLPQVLMMENVPQVHGKANMPHFQKWLNYLESKGYTSYWQDMNAKNYGVAQSRNRTIVISFLGSGTFKFPKPYPLEKTMADYLEDSVDEKFYISTEKAKILIDKLIINGKILTDRQTDRPSNCRSIQSRCLNQEQLWQEKIEESAELVDKETESVRLAGYTTEKPHQSTAVYDTEGICPCLDATYTQHPGRIIQCKKL